MAKLIGGLGTSHVPSIGVALDRGLRDARLEAVLRRLRPGAGMGQTAQARHRRRDLRSRQLVLPRQGADLRGRLRGGIPPRRRGLGARAIPPFKGAVDFSWHFIDCLVENRFDPMICQEIEVDHGIQVPMELFWGRPAEWPVKVVPSSST